jgi:hypothetical protein
MLILECLTLDDVGIFYGHVVYFTAIWDILCLFGTFSPVLVLKKKNLATLVWCRTNHRALSIDDRQTPIKNKYKKNI